MKKINWLEVGILVAVLLVFIGFILFSDVSFRLIGFSVIILGILAMIKINIGK